jgi:hypothetical protein
MEVPEIKHAEGEQARIFDIVSVSRDEAWAFGAVTEDTTADPSHVPFALRWNGEEWRNHPDAFEEQQTPSDSPLLAADDGGGGFVVAGAFGAEQHRTREGAVQVIKGPEPVGGRTDEITEVDRKQHVELYDLQLAPGTREIWGVGAVGVSPLPPGEEYSRGVVVSYTADD